MAKKLGPIWDYFTQIRSYNVEGYKKPTKISSCNLCEKQFTQTDGATTSLRNHLRRVHPKSFEQFEKSNQPGAGKGKSKLPENKASSSHGMAAEPEVTFSQATLPLPKLPRKVRRREGESEAEETSNQATATKDIVWKGKGKRQENKASSSHAMGAEPEVTFSQATLPLQKVYKPRMSTDDTEATDEITVTKHIVTKKEISQKGAQRTVEEQQATIEIMWALTLVAGGVSFALSDAPMTTWMLSNWFPEFQLQSANDLVASALETIHFNMTESVKKIVNLSLTAQDKLTVTAGLFTGQRGNFLEISLQFIDQDFQYQHVILGRKQISLEETAISLKDQIDGVLDEYNGLDQKDIQYVYDNNNDILHTAIQSSRYGTESIHCIVKKMDTTVRVGLENTDTGKELLKSAYNVIFWLNTSVEFMQEIKQICRDLDVEYIHVPKSVADSDIVKSLLTISHLQEPLAAYRGACLEKDEMDPDAESILNANNFQVLSTLVPFFNAFAACNNVLKLDEVITHRYHIDILNLQTALTKAIAKLETVNESGECLSEEAKETAQAIHASFIKEFNVCEKPDYESLVQTFLHPSYKAKIWLTPSEYHDFLAKLINGEPSTIEFYEKQDASNGFAITNFTKEELEELPEGRKRMLEIESLERQQLQSRGKELPPIQKEVDIYLGISIYKDDIDVLTWWRENTSTLPLLSKMARRVLSNPLVAYTSIQPYKENGVNRWENSDDLLSDTTLEKLMFTQANHRRVAIDLDSWNLSLMVNKLPSIKEEPEEVNVEVEINVEDSPVLKHRELMDIDTSNTASDDSVDLFESPKRKGNK